MELVKKLFVTKKEPAKDIKQKTIEKINYSDYGFLQAKHSFGKIPALKINLHRIYQDYKQELKENSALQQKLKEPVKLKFEELQVKKENYEKRCKHIAETKIPGIKTEIDKLNNEIDDIKHNPQEYIGEKAEKVAFYIGSFILFFLTVYLYIFYSSASYSAFFRVFSPEIGLTEAMLAPNAYSSALSDGFGEFAFIILMPFVFIALGYLIHKFTEKKLLVNYIKVLFLLMVTFIFDGFLAYKISEGLQSVNQTLETEDYTVLKAFQDVNFWVVIFAGFVAYIVWGLVFSFVMNSYKKLDKVATLVKIRHDKIKRKEQTIDKLNDEIDKTELIIRDIDPEIKNQESQLNSFVFNTEEFGRIHYQFMTGWIQYMSANHIGDTEIKEAENIATQFLEVNIQGGKL